MNTFINILNIVTFIDKFTIINKIFTLSSSKQLLCVSDRTKFQTRGFFVNFNLFKNQCPGRKSGSNWRPDHHNGLHCGHIGRTVPHTRPVSHLSESTARIAHIDIPRPHFLFQVGLFLKVE